MNNRIKFFQKNIRKCALPMLLMGLVLFKVQGQTDSMGQGRLRLIQEKERFILDKVPFLDSERESFIKIFREAEQKRMGLHRHMRETRRRLAEEADKLKDEELNRLLDYRMNLERLLLEEREKYQKALRQTFPPSKVLEIFQAEREFMKRLHHRLRDFPEGPPPPMNPYGSPPRRVPHPIPKR